MKLSIIVPIYNAEKYIEKCIISVINQNYEDIQVILVNDGSTDKSGYICKKYAQMDNRILYIEKSNGGIVSSRKTGIINANGEYVGWVDADDWVENNYFGNMMTAQYATGADIVCATHFHDIGENSEKITNFYPVGVYKKEDLFPHLLYGESFFEFGIQPHVWSKLFKRELLLERQVSLDESIVYGEDAAVTYSSLLRANTICVTNITGYHYVQRQNTIAKSECFNEKQRLLSLINYLKKEFSREDLFEILVPQLNQYEKYVFLMRQIQELDKKLAYNGEILLPYGGIKKCSNVIIYGAGVLGQKIYYYLNHYNLANVVLWIDVNYKKYQSNNLDVHNPKEIINCSNFDFVLIANSLKNNADAIISYLNRMNVPSSKIRWLAPWFTNKDFKI